MTTEPTKPYTVVDMNEKMFPIQAQHGATAHPLQIPWSIAELAYSVYHARYPGQTLERLAQRGGFGPGEMDDFLPDWRERCAEITLLRAQLLAANAEAKAWRDWNEANNHYSNNQHRYEASIKEVEMWEIRAKAMVAHDRIDPQWQERMKK